MKSKAEDGGIPIQDILASFLKKEVETRRLSLFTVFGFFNDLWWQEETLDWRHKAVES